MLQLKVCGMKNSDNIAELIEVQPDYIGLIFHEKSPRNVDYNFPVKLPDDINKVGVFVNETEGFILDRVERFDIKYVQLHGKESAHFCGRVKKLNRKIIKAFNIHEAFDFNQLKEYEPYCDYFLFDAFGKKAGGNGITFNWSLLKKYTGEIPFLLSGGINIGMEQKLKTINHPMLVGIDINSKFELEPGIKNIKKIKQFSDELRS